jgi:hypothetical protein
LTIEVVTGLEKMGKVETELEAGVKDGFKN